MSTGAPKHRKPHAAIFDMDGTLADVSGIRHHVIPTRERPWKNFDAFHSASVDCPPNQWVVDLAKQCHDDGLAVLIVTARRAKWRHHTAWWLALHGVPSDAMFMRHDDDERPDYEVKASVRDRIALRWEPVLAVDDRPSVLQRVWRAAGVPTVQVPGWQGEDPQAAA